MKLDYKHNINEYGDNMVRLFDFDMAESILFRQAVQTMLDKKSYLDVSTLPFIELRNCNLVLRLSDTDEGIRTNDRILFFCDLTEKGYENMIGLLNPFCMRETKGYQYLYDIDSLTDFLFSPGGV